MISIGLINYKSANKMKSYIDELIDKINIEDYAIYIIDNSCDYEEFDFLIKIFGQKKNLYSQSIISLENQFYIIYRGIKIIFLQSPINFGFSKAHNLLLKIANHDLNSRFHIISNCTLKIKDNILDIQKLLNDFKDDIACVGPKIISEDNIDQTPYKYISIYRKLWFRQILFPLDFLVKPIKKINSDIISHAKNGYYYRLIGAFMIVDFKKLEKCDFFDENTFLYAEEEILAERLKKLGYKMWYDASITLIHEIGGTSNVESKNKLDKFITREKRIYQSELYYYQNYIKISNTINLLTKLIKKIYFIKLKILSFIYWRQ